MSFPYPYSDKENGAKSLTINQLKMKKVIFPIVMLFLVGFSAINAGLTDEDRKIGLSELAKSQDFLKSTVDGLSDAQLNYKSSPESWSVAECVEHLAISESMIGGMLQEALKTEADPSKRSNVAMTDEQLLTAIGSRDQKVKTGEAFEPSGKFGSYEDSLIEFLSKREAHIAYLNSTQDDLRNHYAQAPFGTIDGLQVLLFMSAHTERHVKQMKEVMADPGFPLK